MTGASVALYSVNHVFETKADADGAFEFSGLPPDRYELQTVIQGFKRKVVSGIHVPGSDSEPLDLNLSPLGPLPCSGVPMLPSLPNYKPSMEGLPSLEGTVQTAGLGKALPRARVGLISSLGSHTVLTTSTDDTGRFSFRRVSSGKYTLRVALRGYFTGTASGVWLVSGHVARVRLQLLSSQGKGHMVCQ